MNLFVIFACFASDRDKIITITVDRRYNPEQKDKEVWYFLWFNIISMTSSHVLQSHPSYYPRLDGILRNCTYHSEAAVMWYASQTSAYPLPVLDVWRYFSHTLILVHLAHRSYSVLSRNSAWLYVGSGLPRDDYRKGSILLVLYYHQNVNATTIQLGEGSNWLEFKQLFFLRIGCRCASLGRNAGRLILSNLYCILCVGKGAVCRQENLSNNDLLSNQNQSTQHLTEGQFPTAPLIKLYFLKADQLRDR